MNRFLYFFIVIINESDELYQQYIDHYGNKTNISKIDFSRQLNKFGFNSGRIQIEGTRLNGYTLNYKAIMKKIKQLKIEIKIPDKDDVCVPINKKKTTNIFNDLDFS